jgi:hypothetical protein
MEKNSTPLLSCLLSQNFCATTSFHTISTHNEVFERRMRANSDSMSMPLEQLCDGNERLHVSTGPADVDCDVQLRSWCCACFLVDELVNKGCTSSARPCTLRRSTFSSVILHLVEPVLEVCRIPVKLYCDLAESVDTSSTLRFLVMVLAVSLIAAEVERHRATDSNSLLHRCNLEMRESNR